MPLYFLFVSIPLIFCYLAIVNRFVYYWKRTDEWHIPVGYKVTTKISVVVAARNESESIRACLQSLKKLNYPASKMEILIINDHSEDNTAAIVIEELSANMRLFNLPEGQFGKKSALKYAVEQASGTLIVCTDADCQVPANWLLYLASYYEKKQCKFIAAPVVFYDEKTKLEKFQSLDFMGMMAVAAAGVRGGFMQMSNGANLAYEKAVFEELNGFEGHEHIASGDDMLLMEKVAAHYPDKIGFLKQINATTRTLPQPHLKAFIAQRIRWASKTGSYSSWQVKFILLMVWLLCLSMLIDLILIPWIPQLMYIFLCKFIIKAVVDFRFLSTMAHFFNRKDLLKSFLPAFIYHCLYIVFIGLLANLFKQYHWKGRQTR